MRRARRLNAAVTAGAWWIATALACWACAYAVRRADDLWWHLAAGRWMLDHRAVARTDTFSFTAAGSPWLNDAWLADVLLALWAAAGGQASLVWWKWGLVVTTFLLLFATARRAAHDPATPAAAAPAAFTAVVLAAVTAEPFLDLRPQLYSLLGVALVLYGCVGRRAPALWLPVIFLAWANLHAGFIFGLGALAVLLAPSVRGAGPPRRRALAVAGLSAAACLANPHGATALTRPLRYALDASSPFHALVEWWPPFRPGGVASAAYPYLIGVFVVAALATLGDARLRRRPASWTTLALGATTLAMSLTSRRFVPVFALVQAVAVAPVAAIALAPVARRLPPLLPALAALVLGGVWLAPYPQATYAFHYLTAEDHFPVETATFIETNALAGNVFAQYAWAGYVTMRTGGRLKVYIDGRADAVYADAQFTRYQRAAQGEAGWMTVIEDSAADWVLWPRHLPSGALPQALLRSGRWTQVHVDAVAVLLRRADGGAPARYAPTPDSPFRHYALGVLALERGALDDAAAELTRALATAPHLRRACNALASVRARQGDVAAGWATIARCQAVFPDPERVAWFAAQVRR